MCALVVFVFVFPGQEHGWFRVRVGHDEVLVVRVLGFSLGVVHMWMWCLGLGVCCSPYPAVCAIQFLPFASEVYIVWVCPPSPQFDHPPGSSRATLTKSTCVVCWKSCRGHGSHQSQIHCQIAGNDELWLNGSLFQA